MANKHRFVVSNKRNSLLKIIPYVGCKAGFKDIFDVVIPDCIEGRIYDVFGGGGSFTFYACYRFGSSRVNYNDNNPVLVNLIRQVQKKPVKLWELYNAHYKKSSPDYYYEVREKNSLEGIEGAANFLYLAKNAFSGKIRFNSSNQFNSPIRKGSSCPRIECAALTQLSEAIKNLTITNLDYKEFAAVKKSLLYLDPPYFNNANAHYNKVLSIKEFNHFLRSVESHNQIVLSEQNDPAIFELPNTYTVHPIILRRSLQYFTQTHSEEIIAVNY